MANEDAVQVDLGDTSGEQPPTDIQSEDGEPTDAPGSEEKVNWEEPSQEYKEGDEPEDDEAGVQIGMGPFGPVIIVTGSDGTKAQKTLGIEELWLLSGQLNALASFLMGMNMQQQMAEQARLQAMLQQNPGEERTASGLYVKK